MRIAFREKPYDLLAVAVFGLALVLLAMVAIEGIVRIALGLLFILVLPGYSLTAALFPGAKDIDWIERITLSLGLSITIVPLLGLMLNYTPWGIRLEPVIALVLLFTLGMCAVAYFRRMRLPAEERLSLTIDIRKPPWQDFSTLDKALSVVLAASIIIAAGTFVYVMIVGRQGESFTEFFILDRNGTAADYPTRLNASEQGTVIVCVRNHESSTINYTVKIVLVTVQYVYNATTGRNDTIEISSLTLESRSSLVGDNLEWRRFFNFTIPLAGDYKLRFLLHKGDQQQTPYRALHLLIKVA